MTEKRPLITIAASAAASAALGTVHAFSVFVPQWERTLDASRADVSLIYSVALVALTGAVLFGYRLYARLSPPAVFLLVGALGATGLWMAALSQSLSQLYVSYGLVFGAANGLGYGYALQLAGQAAKTRRGLAMSVVTAFYAVGAVTSPAVLLYLIDDGGNALALKSLAAMLSTMTLLVALAVWWSGARYRGEAAGAARGLTQALRLTRRQYWLAYGAAVTAGLMIIGHAHGIAVAMQLAELSAGAPTVVALGNMAGGFSAGLLADRTSGSILLRWLPALSMLGLLILIVPVNAAGVALFALGLIGYSYGALIAIYPVVVADTFGTGAAPRIYGQIFTAWGLAGLIGPWMSGWLFDLTQTYTMAILVAVALSAVSIYTLSRTHPGPQNTR